MLCLYATSCRFSYIFSSHYDQYNNSGWPYHGLLSLITVTTVTWWLLLCFLADVCLTSSEFNIPFHLKTSSETTERKQILCFSNCVTALCGSPTGSTTAVMTPRSMGGIRRWPWKYNIRQLVLKSGMFDSNDMSECEIVKRKLLHIN